MITRRRIVNSEVVFALILTEKSLKWCRENREKKRLFSLFRFWSFYRSGCISAKLHDIGELFFTVVLRIECSTNAVSFIEI